MNGSYSILIVEDEQITALDLKATLEELGHRVVASTARAEKSIELALAKRPDLVLMDIHLADDMLGTEAASVIHSQLRIPVIFLTAYTDDETMADALESFPYGYLVKPYERREIGAAIKVAMNRHDADQQLRVVTERLQMALKSAQMKLWEWHPEEDDQLAEPQPDGALQPLDTSLDDLLQQLHQDDRDALLAELASKHRVVRLLRLKNDGQFRWFRLFATVSLAANQRRQVTGLLQDVDDEQRLQSDLKQADLLFRSTAEGLVITDRDQRIKRVNPAFVQISGYSEQELLGKNPVSLLYARRSDDNPIQMATALDSWSGEVVCRRKNGEIFPAWEHISKTRDADGSLSGYIFNLSDISRLRRAEQNLTQMAYVDPLTGLGNRLRFEKNLQQAIEEQREGESIGIAYLDLDGFKLVNDTLGHAEGDTLLKVLAQRLVAALRDEDTIARLGGDEFVVVVPRIRDADGMDVVARKILQVASESVKLSREKVQVSASIGVVISDDATRELDELLRAADTAMFEAKKQGKNRYCVYDFALDQEYRQRVRIEADLRDAIVQNEFVLGYQPLFEAGSGRLCGAEALIRWQHPDLGLLAPASFISIAEQSDAIISIGNWVLEEACRTISEWLQIGLSDVRMAVNISPRQMADDDFPDHVAELLQRYQLDADCLELELTETALQASGPLLPQLNRIRQMGVHLAIDDFGTGYSSLGRLKELPFDRVKIDRSFVRDLPDDADDIEICRAIIALCRVLDLSVTAEGVETPQQEKMLREMGCDCLQGFLYSADISSDKFTECKSRRFN
ncbi:two-component system response regulator [Oceanobacter mangrovi]|uniref:two-component system response regulator n=1 Tax=Oceanobacter mangrovi TaxID=2862510 RepID=UPI001C8D29DB|nr:EAL domain-containing protein [Oceanobacter mangrovi]